MHSIVILVNSTIWHTGKLLRLDLIRNDDQVTC